MDYDPTATKLQEQRARGIRIAIIIALVIVVLRYLPITSNLFVFSLIDNAAYDIAFEQQGQKCPDDIVIIAIDDESLRTDRLGRFPWPRDAYVRLLKETADAKVVGLDILFAEPDAYNPEADAEFAAAIRAHGKVVLAAYKNDAMDIGEQDSTAPEGLRSYPMPVNGHGHLRGISPANLTGPIASLADAAAGVGFVDITADQDGVYRRVSPLLAGSDGNIYPHFATEIARLANGMDATEMVAQTPGRRITVDNRALYLNGDGDMLINYCGPTGTIRRYGFWEVVNGKIPAGTFKDKLVLVGATAPGLYDIRPAPYRTASRFFLGVETNANIVNSLLHRPPLRDNSRAISWLLVAMVLGTLAGWTVWSSSEYLGPLMGVLLLLFIALPSFFVAFYMLHSVIPYAAIALATALPVGLGIYERLGAERRMIRSQFSSYVSEDVLAMLMQDPDMVREGTSREITLLFSDVRGSTALAEQSVPQEWLAQLNEYMSEMTEAIFEYDGYLDKFMGDGIMAIWNAFGTQEHHAHMAVRAGLEMLQRLEFLNHEWERSQGRRPFSIGLALHTGDAMLGDAGSTQRRQYTAIGDTVNTASRIEAMNKEFGTTFIISEATAELVRDNFELRDIGEVEVRGRSEGIRVFEVLGEK